MMQCKMSSVGTSLALQILQTEPRNATRAFRAWPERRTQASSFTWNTSFHDMFIGFDLKPIKFVKELCAERLRIERSFAPMTSSAPRLPLHKKAKTHTFPCECFAWQKTITVVPRGTPSEYHLADFDKVLITIV